MKTLWRSPFLTLSLAILDAAALWQIWLGAYTVRLGLNPFISNPINPPVAYHHALPFLLPCWLLILARCGFYAHHERIASLNRLRPLFWAVFWMGLACTVYNLTFKPDFGRLVVLFFLVKAGAYLWITRSLFRWIKRRSVERGHGRVRVLVIGAGDLGRETVQRIREHPDIGFKIAGFLSADPGERRTEIAGCPVLGGLDALMPLIRRHQIEEIFLAVPEMQEDEIFELIERVQNQCDVVCKVVANMLYVIVNRAKVDEIIGLPVIAFRGNEMVPAQQAVKRALDLLGGGLLALAALPLGCLFALLIRLDSPGPVLFVHDRIGLDGRRFPMWKFRTMRIDSAPYAEAPLDQEDPRVTRFGRFLRRTSLDEIPQLLNILRGDMGLVGPRPEMPFIVEGYQDWQRVRLRAKPGLTGLWQVAGRKNLPLHFNLEYDFYYVKNQSLSLDAEILLRTVPAVLLGRGAY